ncbi:MAG: DUF5615 family PIN-like protein [Nocardioidaceae bacterium]
MRLLIDANLSPRIAARLRQEGYEVAHVQDVGLVTAADEDIVAHAGRSGHGQGR